jgi:hypothetical protein
MKHKHICIWYEHKITVSLQKSSGFHGEVELILTPFLHNDNIVDKITAILNILAVSIFRAK